MPLPTSCSLSRENSSALSLKVMLKPIGFPRWILNVAVFSVVAAASSSLAVWLHLESNMAGERQEGRTESAATAEPEAGGAARSIGLTHCGSAGEPTPLAVGPRRTRCWSWCRPWGGTSRTTEGRIRADVNQFRSEMGLASMAFTGCRRGGPNACFTHTLSCEANWWIEYAHSNA